MLIQERETTRNWQPIIKQFEAIAGKNNVIRRKEELLVYECDGLTSYRNRPDVVVLPRTTAEVAAIVIVCAQNQIPFVTRGSGTGLSGGALPVDGCVLIVTTLMSKFWRLT